MHIPPGERYAHSAIMLPTLQLCSLLMGEGGGERLGGGRIWLGRMCWDSVGVVSAELDRDGFGRGRSHTDRHADNVNYRLERDGLCWLQLASVGLAWVWIG